MWGARVVKSVAAALAGIALLSGLLNLTRRSDPQFSENAVVGLIERTKSPRLGIAMTTNSLDPAERRVQATLTIVSPGFERGPKFFDVNGEPIAEAGEVRPEFADSKLTIEVSTSRFGTTTISPPLADVVDPPGSKNSSKADLTIPVDVDPAQFPNDSYSLGLSITVTLPPNVFTTPPPKTESVQLPVIGPEYSAVPFVFGLAADNRLGQWVLSAAPTTDSVRIGVLDIAYVNGEFGRGWTYWAFIYSVSLMPAVIGLSFFVRTRRKRGISAGDASSAMELAAALLALIALRQVFVPTDIVGLTRLDFVLGVQLLAVCWLMAVTYVADPPPAKPSAVKHRRRVRKMTPRPPDGAFRRRVS